MSNVRMPIETSREGDKITKICVEDVYKIINRIQNAMDKAYNNSIDIINSIHKTYNEYEGELIIGTGVSQPCKGDEFDEKLGNNIAFMKAKLNANIKKANFIRRIYKEYLSALFATEEELDTIENLIMMDLTSLREYNEDYLTNFEDNLMYDESEE